MRSIFVLTASLELIAIQSVMIKWRTKYVHLKHVFNQTFLTLDPTRPDPTRPNPWMDPNPCLTVHQLVSSVGFKVQVICVIEVIFSSCLNMLLTYIRNLLSFGYYINMSIKIAGPALLLRFVCMFFSDVLNVFRFFRLTIVPLSI